MSIDTIGKNLFWLAFIVPIISAILLFIVFRKRTMRARLLISISIGLATFTSMTVAWTSILFRDGMAPGMISSSGATALLRSLDMNVFWSIVAVILFLIGIIAVIKTKSS